MNIEIPRDRYKRPYIVPHGGDKAKAYTRISKYSELLTDSYMLNQWQQRKLAQGLEENRFLLPKVATAVVEEDDKALQAICAVAKDMAGGNEKADYGSRLHSYTDALDRGVDFEWPSEDSPEYSDLMAYASAVEAAGLRIEASERFVANDEFRVAGTFDRVVTINGQKYIADLKTGRLDIAPIKFAMQFALYANADYYECLHDPTFDEFGKQTKEGCDLNPALHNRSTHGAHTGKALLIHLPAEEGRCDMYWVDITEGYAACYLARQVKERRNRKDFLTPFNPEDPPF